MPKTIPLTQGYEAIVDDDIYEYINQWKWLCQNGIKRGRTTNYAARCPKWHGKWIIMHRLIINAPAGVRVDHKNGNGLDNRRDNLRLCTPNQNTANSIKKRTKCLSIYKGVTLSKNPKLIRKWLANIKPNGKLIYLGCFYTEEEAAEAYNKAALKYYGEYAKLNIIEEKNNE